MVKYIAPSFEWRFASDSANLGYEGMEVFTLDSKVAVNTEEEKEEEPFDISVLPQHILMDVVEKMPNIARIQLRMSNRSISKFLDSKDEYFSKRSTLGSDISFFVELQSPNTITLTTNEMGTLCRGYTTENHVEALRGFSVNKLTIDVYEECFDDDDIFEELLEILKEAKICCNHLVFTGIPADFAIQIANRINCFGEIRFSGRFCNTGKYIETINADEKRSSFYVDLEETHSYLYEPHLNHFWDFAGFTEKIVFKTDLLMKFISELCSTKKSISLKKAEIQILDPSVPPFDSSLEAPMYTVLWNKSSLTTPRQKYVPDIIRKITTASKWIIVSQICSFAYDRRQRLISTKYDTTVYVIEKDVTELLEVLGQENLPNQFDKRALELFTVGDEEDRFNVLREAFVNDLSSNN